MRVAPGAKGSAVTAVAKQKILIVDDDAIQCDLLAAVFEKEYEVVGLTAPEKAFEAVKRERPDLVVSDIAMPGMTGYQICRAIKADPETGDIPVIFLSGLVTLDDRLAAYEAGGEDFIGKPYAPAELREKAAIALRALATRASLKESVRQAFSTAMAAMSSVAEIGVVLNFIRQTFSCRSYDALARAMLAATAEYGLTAKVQIRGHDQTLFLNAQGESSPLEAAVLATLSGCGRIVDLRARSAFNFERVTLLVVDMPVADEERYGRMRDNLALLVEAADARVVALDAEVAVRQQEQAIRRLVDRSEQALRNIDQTNKTNRQTTAEIMNQMIDGIEQEFFRFGLTAEQEKVLSATLRDGVDNVIQLYDRDLSVDQHLKLLMNEISGGLKSCA